MAAGLFWLCVGLIFYTYLGFPLILTFLAWLFPRQRPYNDHTPTVTLLIAAYNEEAVIARKLENSLELDYPPEKRQILVAADGSSDRTPDIVRQFAGQGVELSYSPPRRGKMAAINRAIPQAKGDIVVFSDANNIYDKQALRELVKPFSDTAVGAVTGAKSIIRGDGVLGESEGLYWRYESFIKKQESRLGSCTGAAGEILAIRRDLYEPPPDYVINDDFYIATRLIQQGHQVIYAPKARSYERVSATAEDEVARRARIIAGRYQAITLARHLLPFNRPFVVWQIVSHKFLRPLVPLAMIGALVANLALVINPPAAGRPFWQLPPPFNLIALSLQFTFYLLAWIGSKTHLKGLPGKILYLPTFLVNSNKAALIGLFRFLTGRQTVLWQQVRRQE